MLNNVLAFTPSYSKPYEIPKMYEMSHKYLWIIYAHL